MAAYVNGASAARSAGPRCLYIPVNGSQEEVQVFLDDLPDHLDLLDVLKAEQAPLDIWLALAREYFKKGKTAEFLEILTEGSSPEVDEYYAHVTHERIAILNALAAYHTTLGRISTTRMGRRAGGLMMTMGGVGGSAEDAARHKDEQLIRAVELFNRSSRIDREAPSTWLGKGLVQLHKSEWQAAHDMFAMALAQAPDYVPALLGLACVSFNRGRYADALKLYRQALQRHPNCPAVVRLGIGLCHLRLQQQHLQQQGDQGSNSKGAAATPAKGSAGTANSATSASGGSAGPGGSAAALAEFHGAKARQAFERVLKLEPRNADALVALAMLDVNSKDVAKVKRATKLLHAAFEAYPYTAMALNQLANHSFLTAQHGVVEQLADAAMGCTEHPRMKAESLFHLARSAHSQGHTEKALAFYRAATEVLTSAHQHQAAHATSAAYSTPASAPTTAAAAAAAAAEYPLPFFGLAQMLLRVGDAKAAAAALEKVHVARPADPDTLKLLGSMSGGRGSCKAADYFRKLTQTHPNDADGWLELGELLVTTDAPAAMAAFQKAVALLEKAKKPVPWQLQNNIATLLHATAGDAAPATQGKQQESVKEAESPAMAAYRKALGPRMCKALDRLVSAACGAAVLAGEDGVMAGQASRPDEESGAQASFAAASEDLFAPRRSRSSGAPSSPSSKATGSALTNGHASSDRGEDGDEEEGEDESEVSRGVPPSSPAHKLPVLFNIGLLYEKLHDTAAASAVYRAILRRFPSYVDCRLRLACIAKGRGDASECMSELKEALRLDPNREDALLMKSEIEMGDVGGGGGLESGLRGGGSSVAAEAASRAKETIKSVMEMTPRGGGGGAGGQPVSGSFPPAVVALGNWNLRAAAAAASHAKGNWTGSSGSKQQQQQQQAAEASLLERAKELFVKAIKGNGGNVYAAQGLGCVLAERGHVDLAKEVLAQVQEAATAGGGGGLSSGACAVVPLTPLAWLNVAGCHLAKGDFALAVKLYDKCLSRFLVGTPQAPRVRLYLAKACYEAEDLPSCRRALVRAIHEAPASPALRFNLAVATQKDAVNALRAGEDREKEKEEKQQGGSKVSAGTVKTAESVRKAVADLKLALRLFGQLGTALPAQGGGGSGGGSGVVASVATPGLDRRKAELHAEYCRHLLAGAKQHLETAEREEQQRKQKAEVARQAALAEAARRHAEEERRAAEERAKRETEEREAKRKEEEFRKRMENWKRTADKIGDGSEGEKDGEGGGERRKERKRKKKSKKRRGGDQDMEEDGGRYAGSGGEYGGREGGGHEPAWGGEGGDEEHGREFEGNASAAALRGYGEDEEDTHGFETRGAQAPGDEGKELEDEGVERGEGGGTADDALAAAGLLDDDEEEARGDDGGEEGDDGGRNKKRRKQLADSDDDE